MLILNVFDVGSLGVGIFLGLSAGVVDEILSYAFALTFHPPGLVSHRLPFNVGMVSLSC